MKLRGWTLTVAAAGLLLTGCGSSQPTASSMPGMSMSPGQTMPATPASTTAARPSAAAQMICSPDIKGKVKQVLKLATEPATRTSFTNGQFTCTYDLPMGPLVLSVQDSSTQNGAIVYFTKLRPTLGVTTPLIGLGQRAYGTTAGKVVVLKDSHTLGVDATALPPIVGNEGQKRADLAYEIASDVLGCWTNG